MHLLAKKECNDAEIAVYNTAVDEENKTFVGAGEFYIIAYSKKPDELGASSIDKNKALGEIKKYISSFCGKESADAISDADM